jgi:hypothetical protein
MAQYRPEIGKKIKNKLRGEVGNKCANPGCANLRTHIHHIREWAVYETHDEDFMIAVCPACHDAIHHGALAISDETLLDWKGQRRADRQRTGHIYIEPSSQRRLLLGSIAVTADSRAAVFSLSPDSNVGLSIEDDEIVLLDLRLCSARGVEIMRVARSGHYKAAHHPDVSFDQRPGAFRVTVPCSPEFIPNWLIWAIHAENEVFIREPVTMIAVEVVEPGIARVEGIWVVGSRAIVVTKTELKFYAEGGTGPQTIVGAGKDSLLHFTGKVGFEGVPLFGFR